MSPTQRTLAEARSLNFQVQVVERWVPQARRRVDLFGCIDLVAAKEGVGILGIQACARSSHAARRTKALAEPKLREWLAAGGRFEIWSWGKMKTRVNRKQWQVWREELTADDLSLELLVAATAPHDPQPGRRAAAAGATGEALRA